MADCYVNSQCFTLQQHKDYNAGYRQSFAGYGPACGLELFEGVGCTGASSPGDIPSRIGEWTPVLFATINTDVYVSGRVYCYVPALDFDAKFDTIYLSPAPGGY